MQHLSVTGMSKISAENVEKMNDYLLRDPKTLTDSDLAWIAEHVVEYTESEITLPSLELMSKVYNRLTQKAGEKS